MLLSKILAFMISVIKFFFFLVVLSGKKDPSQVRRRRRKDKDDEEDDEVGEEDMELPEEEMKEEEVVVSDGVFTMKIGPASQGASLTGDGSQGDSGSKIFSPPPRMNCGLAVKHGVLYLYGGMVEEGEKQLTLADMYALGKQWSI